MERVMAPEKRVSFRYFPSYKLPKSKYILFGVLLSTSLISACSQVPDAINPAEWYRGTADWYRDTVDYFFEEEPKADLENSKNKLEGLNADKDKNSDGADETFPVLASVDKQARARDIAKSGLPADNERPRYAPSIKRQGVASSKLGDKPTTAAKPISIPKPIPVSPLAKQPAPPAMPKPFVARKPMPIQNVEKSIEAQQKKLDALKAALLKAEAQAQTAAKSVPSQVLAKPIINESLEADKKRLAKQLAEIRSRAANPNIASLMAKDFTGNRVPTVVISSQGVTVDSVGSTLSQVPIAPQPSTPTISTSPSISTSKLSLNQPVNFGNEIKVATIFYDNGSYKLKAHDKKILNSVARFQRKEGGQFRIVGHASSRTRDLTPIKHKMVNFKVSMDRADEIAATLVQLGVNKQNIQVAALSDTQPAYYEYMLSGEAGNRRAEIYLTR